MTKIVGGVMTCAYNTTPKVNNDVEGEMGLKLRKMA